MPAYLNKNLNAIPVYSVDGDGNILAGGSTASNLPAGTDRSGTIVSGGTAQQVAAANANRKGLTFQNVSSVDMVVSENGTDASASNGYVVPPNSTVRISTNRSISVFSTLTGARFAATEV